MRTDRSEQCFKFFYFPLSPFIERVTFHVRRQLSLDIKNRNLNKSRKLIFEIILSNEYRANGNFAERGSGRGGGPGGVRSTRCTLPGGVPGGPLFHRSTFLSTSDKKLPSRWPPTGKSFCTRRFNDFISQDTVIRRGVKKGQKKANFTEISSGLFLHRRLVHP